VSRPSPLEIQDALYGGALRTAVYGTAAIAVVAFVAPWEAGPNATAWTWDIWRDAQPFFLLPLICGVLVAVLGWLEAVPGIAVGGAALGCGLLWTLVSADQFALAFGAYGAGVSSRTGLAGFVLPALLAGLAWRRALHRTLVGRVFLGAGALATVLLFVVPLGEEGTTLVQVGILDPLAAQGLAGFAAALPLIVVALAALGSFAALSPSQRSTDGFSTLTLILFHALAVAVAFGHLVPFLVGLPDLPAIGYGTFAAPLKLGALWYTALLWLGLGGGTAAAALEAMVRRGPIGRREAGRTERPAAGAQQPRPVAQGQPVVLASSDSAPRGPRHDLSPLPAPSGLAGAPGDGDSQDSQPREPSEVVEIAAQHVLPILDAQTPSRSAASVSSASPVPAPLPAVLQPAAAGMRAQTPGSGPRPLPTTPGSGPRPLPTSSASRISTPPPAARPFSAPQTLRGAPSPDSTSGTPLPSRLSSLAPPGTPPPSRVPSLAPPGAPPPSRAPSLAPPGAPGAGAPAPTLRRSPGRTQLGMPSTALPAGRPALGTPPGGQLAGPGGAGPQAVGRTGDTSLGLPVVRPAGQGQAPAPPPAPDSGEVSGLRFWPPTEGEKDLPRTREAAPTPAFGVDVLRQVAMRQTPAVIPATAGIKREAAPAPAAVRLAEPEREVSSDAPDSVRHRISILQRQLARGEISPDVYQQRLDEILKKKR
jgi:hypothetical protein